MKNSTLALIGIIFLTFGATHTIKAQTMKLLAGNTLNGAMNGVLLGGATMALQNTNDFDPVRVGVGLGALYGVGAGIYDVSTVSIGDQFYISGIFNDGTNSTIIVLLDTFYGAAAGAVVSTSVSLITDKPILEGLQYGSGAGAWIGFGFGLIDSFMFAKRLHVRQSVNTSLGRAGGLIRYSNPKSGIELGLLNPSVSGHKIISRNHIGIRYAAGMEIVNLNVRF